VNSEPESKNRMRVAEVRTWALEHLQLHETELAQFPDLVREPHWNLWMADYDVTRDAVFVVMMFRHSGIEVWWEGERIIRSACLANMISRVTWSNSPEHWTSVFKSTRCRSSFLATWHEQWLDRTIHPQEA
jgi:hypothetical protein